ncbi:Hsp20/alpha crystallin family protein [Flaviaesturariibacter amylovorans]|uniref:SHSP domain-containing protein n=1 Tax=Flaviaesturariibacter amylovorans TaxID=1084520 RepID=A0ABP8GWD3_9BACT
MTHAKFNPRPGFASFNSLLDDFFAPGASISGTRVPATAARPVVPVNIRETESAFQLEVVAPGFAKEDFDIALEKNLLTVSVQKKSENEAKEDKFLRHEYKFTSFSRSFTVSDSVDTEAIAAEYVNGVLTLNLPKRTIVKSVKQIEVR